MPNADDRKFRNRNIHCVPLSQYEWICAKTIMIFMLNTYSFEMPFIFLKVILITKITPVWFKIYREQIVCELRLHQNYSGNRNDRIVVFLVAFKICCVFLLLKTFLKLISTEFMTLGLLKRIWRIPFIFSWLLKIQWYHHFFPYVQQSFWNIH